MSSVMDDLQTTIYSVLSTAEESIQRTIYSGPDSEERIVVPDTRPRRPKLTAEQLARARAQMST